MKLIQAVVSSSMGIIKTVLAPKNPPRLGLLLTLTLIFFTVLVPLYYLMVTPLFISFKAFSALSSSSPSSSFSSVSDHIFNPESSDSDNVMMKSSEAESYNCDIFTGEWVPNPEAPYYTNTTCWAIHDHQNCMKYGRPDAGFTKWKWKPDGCELPVLNPYVFLELLRGKKLAFVGDSVGRNQMQSLICLLSRVTYPEDVSYTPDEKFKRWLYKDYNFTIASFWSPFLVRSKEADPNGRTLTGLFDLYLDEFDKDWTTQMDEFDYVIISAGHWFFRPSIFYEKGQRVGCHFCQLNNLTDLTKYYGYRKAFRTALKALYSSESFKGVTYLRTFSPSHFEGGLWNEGGNCLRRKPFLSNETRLDGFNLELYMIQVEEFRAAEKKARDQRGLRFRLLDTTQATLLRPDGHPSRYGHWPHEKVTLYNDCVHWCLPGPIDTWNDFLLHMLKMEGSRSYHESRQLHKSDRKLKVL